MRHRNSRPPMQWVPNLSVNVLTSTVLSTIVLVDASAGATAGVPNIARMTIRRILGEVSFQNTAATNALLYMGIYVRQVGSGTNATLDPSVAADADFGWMWRRMQFVQASTAYAFTNYVCVPHGAFVDVKVKRILAPNEQLVLAANSQGAAGGLTLNLRALISRVA